MSAAGTIQSLLDLGNTLNDAWKASNSDWNTFLNSPGCANIEKQFAGLLASRDSSKLDDALDAIEQQQRDLARGRAFEALSPDELEKYQALEKLHREVLDKLLETPDRPRFLSVLVKDVLPVLVRVAEVVIPLLA